MGHATQGSDGSEGRKAARAIETISSFISDVALGDPVSWTSASGNQLVTTGKLRDMIELDQRRHTIVVVSVTLERAHDPRRAISWRT